MRVFVIKVHYSDVCNSYNGKYFEGVAKSNYESNEHKWSCKCTTRPPRSIPAIYII